MTSAPHIQTGERNRRHIKARGLLRFDNQVTTCIFEISGQPQVSQCSGRQRADNNEANLKSGVSGNHASHVQPHLYKYCLTHPPDIWQTTAALSDVLDESDTSHLEGVDRHSSMVGSRAKSIKCVPSCALVDIIKAATEYLTAIPAICRLGYCLHNQLCIPFHISRRIPPMHVWYINAV